jgi:signal transduction histidine kinase
LRTALTRPVGPIGASRPTPGLEEILARLSGRRPELRIHWEAGVQVPPDLEPLASSVLTEALRNADRHSQPSAIDVRVSSDGQTFTLAIENDGAGDGQTTRGGGLGLRLAALEAMRYEGLVEFGAAPGGRWRVRLVVPVGG